MKKIQAAIHPDDDLHYKKFGLQRGVVEPWEDAAVWELMYFGKAGADKAL